MNKAGIVLAVTVILVISLATAIPAWRVAFNNWRTGLLRLDETTVYENIKTVEDTCRSMIASYEADKQKVEVYKTSHPDWADQAKIRANQTAATYNNYILKNSFLWSGNIPLDIKSELSIID